MKLLDVTVHFLAETNIFDTKHKGLNGFPKAEEETRHLIKFMWEASMVKFPTTIYINSLDPHVLEWAKKPHTETISPPVQILSADSNFYTPSNSNVSNLASAVVLMKEYLEKNQATETK